MGQGTALLALQNIIADASYPVRSYTPRAGSNMQTVIIFKLGFNQNHYTFTLKLLIKIVRCCKFH